MSHSLLISVQLHEGWYHGSDPSPSPARLYQALIAGQGLKGPLTDNARKSLAFLEGLEPPVLATPSLVTGQPVVTYVPNNDLDSKQGDHRRIGEIRTQKRIHPRLFNAEVPFLFVWSLSEEQAKSREAQDIVSMANDLYQLGRTVDAAWAWAEIVAEDEASERIQQHQGPVHQPGEGPGSVECPTVGSLDTVLRRHNDMSLRYGLTADRKGQTFRRRAKSKWRRVNYSHRESFVSFDLTDIAEDRHYCWPMAEAARLVEAVRDAAVTKLTEALPARETDIQQTLIGRKPDGSNRGRSADRVRIIPLPSVGHEHADRQIRRITMAIPSSCPLQADDVTWAFSGLEVEAEERRLSLIRSSQNPQAKFYKIASGNSASWQSVTAIALNSATRRRIEPDKAKRKDEDLKSARERTEELSAARGAVRNALRHAGITTEVVDIRLQREPFDAKGLRAEEFAEGTRFSKHGMWHAQIDFAESVPGPIVIGDGRFLGLGVMNAVNDATASRAIHAFTLAGIADDADALRICGAFRRAVMSRVRDVLPVDKPLPSFFSGHRSDGAPSDSAAAPHLYFACDLKTQRMFVIPPSIADRSLNADSAHHLKTLALALRRLSIIQAGRDGVLNAQLVSVQPNADRLFKPAKRWRSITPYTINRHGRRKSASELIVMDVHEECRRRKLPRPSVKVESFTATSAAGLQALVELEFEHPIAGPILIGRTRHKGGGLFEAVSDLSS